MTIRRKVISSAVLLASVSWLPVTAAAAAQEAGASETRDVVTVTARRREESLQDVPVSVTAYSGAQLEAIGAQDITRIAQTTPNVTLEVSRGTNSTLTAFIRGIGQQDPVAGFEAGVGIYIDDVYLNRPQAAVLDIFDVERIEVLRGPQGTLYGRNTVGGAVKYVTRRLSDEPSFSARMNVGSYDQFDVIVSGSAPLSDAFRVGGAVANLTRSGFGTNLTTGQDNYNKRVLAGRISAEFEPDDRIFIRAVYDRIEDTSNPRGGHRLIPSLLTGAPVLDNVFDTRGGLDVVDQKIEGQGVSLSGDIQINDQWTFRSITAWREDSSTTPIDFDSLPGADLDVPALYDNEQFSQEFQLVYSGDRLNGIIGAYYLDAEASTVFDVLLATTGDVLGLPGLNAQTFGNVETETWSVFADFTYDLTPEWSVSLGARYTSDKRASRVLRRTYIGGFSEFFGGSPTLVAVTSDFDGSDSWTDFSPRISVSYQPDAANNFYASFSQGFKGGSFDPRGQTTAAAAAGIDEFEFMRFNPETVNAYEAGWKFTQGGYRHALAFFYNDYTDVQVPGSIGVDTTGDGVFDTFTGVTTNAGAATLWGIEYEGFLGLAEDAFTSGDTLDLNWAIGYLNGEYDEFIDAFGVDISDQAVIQNTPEWMASGTLNYTVPLSNGALSVINTLAYRGSYSQFEIPNPTLDQDGYTLWNASVVWNSNDGRWQAGVHGRNLTDERYKVSGYNFINADGTPNLGLEGTLTAFYGDPRTVTATIAFRY
ncbi:TonB-dependent receptor [Alkalicaulis satelles]|uniref:TonB-dependent receptor n=1 Tax=Alkalicaulis satelles TaxID=2609175 RepID=A0A5M6ZLZ0_9PROT|nr:TonB-dependent receptor [Alkalicaulis satelles]KAA5804754.1 TonB-dependent receptor [Alkalicaulis satelles]